MKGIRRGLVSQGHGIKQEVACLFSGACPGELNQLR